MTDDAQTPTKFADLLPDFLTRNAEEFVVDLLVEKHGVSENTARKVIRSLPILFGAIYELTRVVQRELLYVAFLCSTDEEDRPGKHQLDAYQQAAIDELIAAANSARVQP